MDNEQLIYSNAFHPFKMAIYEKGETWYLYENHYDSDFTDPKYCNYGNEFEEIKAIEKYYIRGGN